MSWPCHCQDVFQCTIVFKFLWWCLMLRVGSGMLEGFLYVPPFVLNLPYTSVGTTGSFFLCSGPSANNRLLLLVTWCLLGCWWGAGWFFVLFIFSLRLGLYSWALEVEIFLGLLLLLLVKFYFVSMAGPVWERFSCSSFSLTRPLKALV